MVKQSSKEYQEYKTFQEPLGAADTTPKPASASISFISQSMRSSPIRLIHVEVLEVELLVWSKCGNCGRWQVGARIK